MVLLLAILNLGPWRETLAFGQINILLMGLMAADLLAGNPSWRHGLPGSGFLVGIAAGIKLTPLVFGLYFLMRKDWRGLLNMAAGFAATVLLGWLLRPAESLQFWLEILPDTSRIGGAGYVDNLSIKGALLHFGVPAAGVTVPWLALSLLVVGLGAAVIKTASDQGARVVAISATALTMLLISPVSWSHHWVWMAAVLPAFAWTLRETPRRHRRDALGHGRDPGRIHRRVPLLAQNHRHAPGSREPRRPDARAVDHGLQRRRVLRARDHGLLARGAPARIRWLSCRHEPGTPARRAAAG